MLCASSVSIVDEAVVWCSRNQKFSEIFMAAKAHAEIMTCLGYECLKRYAGTEHVMASRNDDDTQRTVSKAMSTSLKLVRAATPLTALKRNNYYY